MDGRVVVQDIPRFLTAFSEWIAVMVVCGCFPRKNWWPGFIAKAVLFLVCQTVFLQMTANVPRVFWIPCMILAVLGMGLFLYSACLLPPVVVFYYTMVAFLTAEFTASLEWQIEFFFLGFPPGDDLFRLATALLVNLAVALTGSWLIGRGSSRFIASITWRESASVFLIAVLAFSMSNISFVTTETPFSVRFPIDVFGLRTMVDLAGLAIMFAHQSRISELVAEREAAAVNTALNAQYDQYRNYLQGIELINIKYHDLKHQIAGMRAEIDPEKRELWLNQIEEELEDFRPEQQTGNAVLDTLIAGKTSVMRTNKIRFTCVADGKLLGAIHVTDICSIFGNALDNAIESVAQEEDPERRLIHLMVTERNGFIFIMMTNYCRAEVNFRDGLPVTTKADRRNHGYGIRSMRHAVQKYNGTLTTQIKNDAFELKILIPLKKEAAS